MFINYGMIIYQGLVRPLSSREKNNIELTNEIFITLSTLHIGIFTDFVLDQEAQYLMGFSMITIIGLCTFFNLFYILKYSFKGLKLVHKRFMIKYKYNLQKLIDLEKSPGGNQADLVP